MNRINFKISVIKLHIKDKLKRKEFYFQGGAVLEAYAVSSQSF